MATLHGGLSGLLTALEGRAEGDKAAVAAQELWLACVAMEAAIRAGREGAADWEDTVRPLSPEISAIQVSPHLGGGGVGGSGVGGSNCLCCFFLQD